MSRFKVGDLITDKKMLLQVIDVKETYYTIKEITGYHQGRITNTAQHWLDYICVKYDLDNPLTKKISSGVCPCHQCEKELHYGGKCVRYDGYIYCDENCLMEYIKTCSEDSVLDEYDVDNSSTTERPLFDLTKEQIEEIKKGKQYE